MVDIISSATEAMAEPATGKILYRPVRLITAPEIIDAPIRPSISGTSSRPELVADAPLTTCRNRGRKAMAPYMATPRTKLTALAMLNVRPRNRWMGRTGSVTRRSTAINPTSNRTEATARPMMVAEPQAYSVPPHVVNSTTDVTAAVSTAEPR